MKTLNFIAIFLLINLCACSKKSTSEETQNTMIESASLSYYHAAFFNDGSLGQNQYYSYKKDSDGVEYILENGKFISDNTILATAYIEFADNKYRLIEIKFDNGSISSNVLVKLEGNQYVSYNKGAKSDSFKVKGINLFSGPNPVFDYLNSKIIKSETSASLVSDSINLLGIINGSMSKSFQTFTFTQDQVNIDKVDLNWKSEIKLSNEDLSISSYTENKGAKDSFVFTKTVKSTYHKDI